VFLFINRSFFTIPQVPKNYSQLFLLFAKNMNIFFVTNFYFNENQPIKSIKLWHVEIYLSLIHNQLHKIVIL